MISIASVSSLRGVCKLQRELGREKIKEQDTEDETFNLSWKDKSLPVKVEKVVGDYHRIGESCSPRAAQLWVHPLLPTFGGRLGEEC